MGEKLGWDEQLATGNEAVDNQHRCIIELAGEINSNLRQEDVKLRILELYRYVREHFEHEEDLMEVVNFPDRSNTGKNTARCSSVLTGWWPASTARLPTAKCCACSSMPG